jgi:ribosomal protein L37AE/L43A
MIRVHLSLIVFFYLATFLGVVGVAWLLDERRRSRRARRALRFRLRCAICGLEFEDRSTAPLPACPRCGRLNERGAVVPL